MKRIASELQFDVDVIKRCIWKMQNVSLCDAEDSTLDALFVVAEAAPIALRDALQEASKSR